MRKHISTSPQPSGEGQTRKMSGRRVLLRGAVGAAAVASLAVGLAGTASAAPGGDTLANVGVDSAITMTGLTPSFTLTGIPGDTVDTALAPVTFNVQTNNIGGYSVTVESATATLAATTGGNTDSIPIGALSVRETGTTPFTALSNAATATVHSQATRSDLVDGDDLSNDYQVVIPFVNSDTYTATLNYLASTL